jgi:aspartyl-tRNA(Asn)/glutamyl-tRNA(Gln) amidotransferase subunit A
MSHIRALANAFRSGEKTVSDVVNATYSAIESTEGELHNFLSLSKESALETAAGLDKQFAAGEELDVLAGVPIGIKDNMNIRGQKTTCASKMLENFVSPFTSSAVQQLLDKGMVPVGKLNMDEFAMGSSTENSVFGASKNPWDLNTVPGGSSGGSASAVSAGQVPVSLGSDTGGSIRQPAAFCGVVGLKPTYGRVSRYGLVAFASSLDQIGPFGETVEDVALVMNALCGHDVHDATSSVEAVPDFTKALTKDVSGLKAALPKELFDNDIDEDVRATVRDAVAKLESMGVTIEEVSMPSLKAAIATYYIIAPAEASSNLARFDGVRYTSRAEGVENLTEMFTKTRGQFFGSEVKRRIILGTYALSSGYYDAYYLKAQKARTLIKNAFDTVFENYDFVISPTTPSVAFKFGEHASDPNKMYIADLCTIPANMAGLPALSVPCGMSQGLPVGLQLVGKAFDEATILKVADAYQTATDWASQKPAIYAAEGVR